ncbi:DUF1016 N-terminal domain-containing protein [Pedobacter duraquae]|uniref:Uncharacterized protein DUF1016 n=1 Tax=Pedobacter duraquae TaxID=425511 RepID=A0A4R6IC60_9SPHI|nr:DUF1016 N-terminal domain-containing protein [Pedobacter duraquae]TDO19522.1 uncharacterized protein DUF1016 [Pedobacter duraquae]
MKRSTQNILRSHDLVTTQVERSIYDRQMDVVRHLTYALNELFWNVGTLISANKLDEDSSPGNQNSIDYLSKKLVNQCGKYFSEENLRLMQLFSLRNYDLVRDTWLYFSWKYVPILLQTDSDDAWRYYVLRIHEKSLNPEELQTEIKNTQFERSDGDYLHPRNSYAEKMVYNLKNSDVYNAKDYFDGANEIALKALFYFKENQPDSQFESDSSINLLISAIYKAIQRFQNDTNDIFNVRFNFAVWHIGDGIKKLSIFLEKSESQIIQDLSVVLVRKYGHFFSQEHLTVFAKFGRAFTFDDDLAEFTRAITWAHIKELLTVENYELRMNYMRIIYKDKLSVLQLLGLIEQHDQSRFALKVEDIYSHGDSEPTFNENIFENQSFLGFISSLRSNTQ